VSVMISFSENIRLTHSLRHTSKQQQTQHLHTGKPQFLHLG
jgi:hypothetical protein